CVFLSVLFYIRNLHSFPTRRSSDLEPVLYPSYNEVFADLDADRVDAIYAGDIYSRYTLNQKGTLDEYEYFVDETSVEPMGVAFRSEEHTSELQSRFDLVCRLLLEKK